MASKSGLRVLALPLTKPVYGLPSFIYYHVQSPPEPPTKKPSWYSKLMEKGSAQWMSWGRQPKTSWKYKLHAWGEASMNSVEYEETSLKAINTSFKPGAENPHHDLSKIQSHAYFIYPSLKDGPNNSFDVWKEFLKERESMHRKYLWRWMIGLPITAPLGIAPIIPNVPFYYCAWRSWAHWKAWRGSQYLNQLLVAQYFIPTNEPELDRIYELPLPSPPPSIPSPTPSHDPNVPEESKLSAPSSTTSSDDQSSAVAPTPNSIPATTPTLTYPPTDVGTVAGRAGADANASATTNPYTDANTNINTNTTQHTSSGATPKVDSDLNTNLANLNLNTHPDAEIDSHVLLHPEIVPHLISAFKLGSVAGADILTAIEQAKARIRKERKRQKQREKEAHGSEREKKS